MQTGDALHMARKRLTETGQGDTIKPLGFDDYELKLGDMLRGERATIGKSLLEVQRELRISANYIAAIEDCDPSAFDTPGFIAGYVRSYARYLKLDPDAVFEQFCAESGFATAHGMSEAASARRTKKYGATIKSAKSSQDDALFAKSPSAIVSPSAGLFDNLDAGAIGSMAVMIALIGGLGYGAWSLLQEIQKVSVTPVDATPVVLSELDPVSTVQNLEGGIEVTGIDQNQRLDKLDRMYRPPALDVPILIARDAPISTLDPNRFGSFTQSTPETMTSSANPSDIDKILSDILVADVGTTTPKVVADAPPAVALVATREAWVQVKSASGTVIFETTMRPGDEYVLPQTEVAPMLRAGMSGSVYFAVNGDLFGPAGKGATVAKNIELSVANLTSDYAPADFGADTELARMVAELQFSTFSPKLGTE
jgi:hypothetical protein